MNVSISFEAAEQATARLQVDDIRFEKILRATAVEDFAGAGDRNLLGGARRIFSSGSAAIRAQPVAEGGKRALRLAFGGNIGLIDVAAPERFSYAGWGTGLGGLDCSSCAVLSFSLRGAEGREKPNIYLDDGASRWGVDIEKYGPVTRSWTRFSIPLADFADYGIDLTRLREVQFVFEWERMSGSIDVADIAFGGEPAVQVSAGR